MSTTSYSQSARILGPKPWQKRRLICSYRRQFSRGDNLITGEEDLSVDLVGILCALCYDKHFPHTTRSTQHVVSIQL